MNKMKLVILDGYTENPGDLNWDYLKENFETTIYDRTPKEKVIERSKDADVLILNKIVITKEILDELPKLKFIAVLATGYNQLDIKALNERNIPVSNIPAYSTDGVAQMVFSYILETTNNVSIYTDAVKNGEWTKCEDFCFTKTPLHELSGKTIGIVGFGKIGSKVSEIANAFGMNVLSFTPSGKKEGFPNVKFTTLDEVCEKSDYITFHCPLTEKTNEFINKDLISKMKNGTMIINTARGGIVNENDVAEALNSGKISYYAADVLSQEPPKEDNPLLSAPNCILTPHISWASFETRERLMSILNNNIKAFLNGKPVNVVNM